MGVGMPGLLLKEACILSRRLHLEPLPATPPLSIPTRSQPVYLGRGRKRAQSQIKHLLGDPRQHSSPPNIRLERFSWLLGGWPSWS